MQSIVLGLVQYDNNLSTIALGPTKTEVPVSTIPLRLSAPID